MSSGKILTCATCGHEEPEGSRFCGNCGAPFVSAQQHPADAAALEASASLVCANCGNEEPEGSQFCGSCGVPFVPADQPPAHTETPPPQPAGEQRSAAEPRSTPPPSGRRRLRWVAAVAAVALLVAGGAVAGVLTLTGGDGTSEATPTEQQPTTAASELPPPASNPTLADSIAPRLEELAVSQSALSAELRSLEAGVEPLAALRQAADALAARVVETQAFLDGLAPTDSTETGTFLLLRRALASHLAYAEAISGLPPRPRSFTQTQAQAAINRAEEVRRAYVGLAVADPALPIIYISRSDHSSLLAVVPSPQPARREIDLVPLLVGVRPDDPLGEGRCFGPYTSRASLRVSGVVHRSGFIQCGDDANGDPSRTSGVYRFSGPPFPAGSRLVRLTGQAVIDESSSSSQRGSRVTWTVFYDGTPICSQTVVWSGPRPAPRRLDCRIKSSGSAGGGFDVRRFQIRQVAALASSGSLWAGVLNPTIVVEVPR